MASIKMAEAIALQDKLEKIINTLIRERNQNATEEIEKGEQATIPARSVDIITDEIVVVRLHLRQLKKAMRLSNMATMIDWDGGIYISDALDLVKDLRAEAAEATGLGNRPNSVRKGAGFGQSAATFVIALYDPEKYTKAGQKGLAIADKLSMLIQKSNLDTEVNVPFAGEYMIVD